MPFPSKQNYRNSFLLGKACVTAVRKFIPRSGNLPLTPEANYEVSQVRGYRFASSKYSHKVYNDFKKFYDEISKSPTELSDQEENFYRNPNEARKNYIENAINKTKYGMFEITPQNFFRKDNWKTDSLKVIYNTVKESLKSKNEFDAHRASFIYNQIIREIKVKLGIKEDWLAIKMLETSLVDANKLLALNIAAKKASIEFSRFKPKKIDDALTGNNAEEVFGIKNVSAKHNLYLGNKLSRDIHRVYKPFKRETGNCYELTWACVFSLKCLPCWLNDCPKPYIYIAHWYPDHANLLLSNDNTLHQQDWEQKRAEDSAGFANAVIMEPWMRGNIVFEGRHIEYIKQEVGKKNMESLSELEYAGKIGKGVYIQSNIINDIKPYLEDTTTEIRNFYNHFNRSNFPRQRGTWF